MVPLFQCPFLNPHCTLTTISKSRLAIWISDTSDIQIVTVCKMLCFGHKNVVHLGLSIQMFKCCLYFVCLCRRETRSKKTSERSEEHPSGHSGLETASEESPLPPPSSGIRETRRSAAKKAQVVAPNAEIPTTDDLESSKEEAKDENASTPMQTVASTPMQTVASTIAENRRVSRLKEKEALGKNQIYY